MFVSYVWGWFMELHQARRSGAMGPSPLTFSDLRDWAAVTGRTVDWWEIQTLKALDMAWIESAGESQSRALDRQKQKAKNKSGK